MATNLMKYASIGIATLSGLYATFILLLTTSSFQRHVIYLHKIQMTWFKDLDHPEQFGFLHNQATPFFIKTTEGSSLYAWHVLPLEIYRQNEEALLQEAPGLVTDFTSRVAFRLLTSDPEARLALHFHGAAGTVGSGYRPPNYRALSAGHPEKIHVLTFDYRGFGRSKGLPTEHGLLIDGLEVVRWATEVAGIPPDRILIFGQSLGTAVALGVSEHFALQIPPVIFAGTILVAPFVDVATLMATYRVAGTVPLVAPLTHIPALFTYLTSLTHDKWSSKDRVRSYVRANELNGERYFLTMIHAEDDYDIPWQHTQTLFWHAVNGTSPAGVTQADLTLRRDETGRELGAAGSVMEWRTDHGVIREEIIKHGLHDVVMGYPVITMAVMRILAAARKGN